MKIRNISKEFISYNFFNKKAYRILSDINFELQKNDKLAIIGPNGAGKTTLFKIILDLIEPSSGTVEVESKKNKYIAYINTNSRSFFWRLSSRNNLIFYGKLLNLSKEEIDKKIIYLSREFGVESILNKSFMKLSSGQMQTMIIIRSLLKNPDYLIFDEATTSMDIEKSNNVLKKLKKIINQKKIPTIWCSHNFEEIEYMCNKFSVLTNGKLKLLSKSDFKNLKKRLSRYCFEIEKKEFEKLSSLKKVKILNEFKNTYLIIFEDNSLSLKDQIRTFINSNIDIIEIVNKKNMDVFTYE
tara:strand:- start:2382 stop:3275 length:894 start_codon:yes stop_codon:yes gene_type:complete